MKTPIAMGALLVAGLAMGALIGWRARTPSPAPVIVSGHAPPVVAEVGRATLDTVERQRLLAEVRAAVREEMARSDRTAPSRPSAAAETPPTTPEQQVAAEQAQSIIAGARHAGRWTADDRERFRQQLGQLGDAQREELMAELLPAINRQEIAMELRGPVF